MNYFYTLLFLFLFVHNQYAQNIFTELKSLEKRADKHYSERSYMTAIDLYRQALKKNKQANNYTLRLKLANTYLKTGQSENAEQLYREAMSNGFKLGDRDSVLFAQILIANNRYTDAYRWMPIKRKSDDEPSAYARYNSIHNLQALYRDSFSFSVKSIIYNSAYADYSPVYHKNGVVFASDKPSLKLIKQVNMQKDAGFSELYFFKERDSVRHAAEPLTLNYKSPLHKGPAIFYDNGTKMMVTVNSKKGTISHLQLFTAEWDKKEAAWTNFQPFPHNSDFYSVGHPALSKDERTLYFVSDCPGGNGGTDIYFSVLKNGEWSKPKNVREPINTEGYELFPYISPSGNLYFASDGHGGLGGLDIFYTNTNSLTNNQDLFNPGYPINSSRDDFGIVLNNKERDGYFTSNRKGGKGDDDIYQLYIKKIEFRLKVSDEILSAPPLNPTLKLIDTETEETIIGVPIEGKINQFSFALKLHHNYTLTISKTDYKSFEKNISTMEADDNQTIELKVALKRKFEYYITLKIRDAETENIVEAANVQVINLSTQALDSIGVNYKGEFDIKLDSESDYLILAFNNKKCGQLTLAKQTKKNVSSVRFLTLTIAEIKEKKLTAQLFDSTGSKYTQDNVLLLRNMITGEERLLPISNEGTFEFEQMEAWYYRLYYNQKQYYFDSLKKTSTGNVTFKIN